MSACPSLRAFCPHPTPATFNTATTEPSPSSRKRRWGHRGPAAPGECFQIFLHILLCTHTELKKTLCFFKITQTS